MEQQAACAHVTVKRFDTSSKGKVFAEEWRCEDCGTKFFQVPDFSKDQGRITIMEPRSTLRDQFAMAAMQGILASCQGPAWGKDVFPIGESAYAYADLMMEARGK